MQNSFYIDSCFSCYSHHVLKENNQLFSFLNRHGVVFGRSHQLFVEVATGIQHLTMTLCGVDFGPPRPLPGSPWVVGGIMSHLYRKMRERESHHWIPKSLKVTHWLSKEISTKKKNFSWHLLTSSFWVSMLVFGNVNSNPYLPNRFHRFSKISSTVELAPWASYPECVSPIDPSQSSPGDITSKGWWENPSTFIVLNEVVMSYGVPINSLINISNRDDIMPISL